ncbi:MAG: GNAT family N-acetyltransferase [Scytonema sp. PMC 1069.18]|nr:GNAT family N-acetyltransferase [Scytonema sp. PMC 1069.18]MEC4887049.1 GNAT family N-acetyltransferase [Scytonema sp. PMC 1070.18]
MTNAPWNTITYSQPETKKGAATSLIEQLVRESQRLELSGILKAMVIPEARKFYEDKGFVETDGSGEMILTSNAASMFILDQEQRLLSQPFD